MSMPKEMIDAARDVTNDTPTDLGRIEFLQIALRFRDRFPEAGGKTTTEVLQVADFLEHEFQKWERAKNRRRNEPGPSTDRNPLSDDPPSDG